MSEKLINALLSPACYPHETDEIRLLETHISWVFLTGPYAYKIKKPLNLGFLDFSTLAKRRFFCAEEVRLNSRFSSGIYREVVAITGTRERPCMGGKGKVLDYAVKMVQFDQDGLLDRLAASGCLEPSLVEELAEKLAHFHLAVAARPAGDDPPYGSFQSIEGPVLENFSHISPRLSGVADKNALARIRTWTQRELEALKETFEARRRGGFIRECHGDLHLANIARIDGEVTFFDCIEFNPWLRWIDVLSEVAFLVMDMEEKGLPAPANGLLNRDLEYTGDYAGLRVLNFYKVYRAMVRAKVALLCAGEVEGDTAQTRRRWKEYREYVALAGRYLAPRRPFLAIMHGVSGTGKSTAAAFIAGETGAVQLRSDVERKRLFGMAPREKSSDELKSTLYSEATSDLTFGVLASLTRALLASHFPVIVDATFIARDRRRPFLDLAKELKVPFVILDCRASETVRLNRLQHREKQAGGVSEAGIAIMRQQCENAQPFTREEGKHVVGIDTEKPLSAESLIACLKE